MRKLCVSAVGIGLLIAGCSSEEPVLVSNPEPVVSDSSEAALEAAANEMNSAIAEQDAEAVWDLYSQRCKDLMASFEAFEIIMGVNYEGRNPDIQETTVKVNGSSGQVVTVDNDPAAPADSMQPRTWTFIDSRWQYDACLS